MKRNLIVICISVCSFVAQAATSCGVSNAKIVDIFQYYDGYVFVQESGVRINLPPN